MNGNQKILKQVLKQMQRSTYQAKIYTTGMGYLREITEISGASQEVSLGTWLLRLQYSYCSLR